MSVPSIHVHSFNGRTTTPYLTFMWDTMRTLASHPANLTMTVHCLGGRAAEQCQNLPNAEIVIVPQPSNGPALTGSLGHGIAIEQAFSMVTDADIHVLVDSDTTVLARGWDDYVRIQLLEKGVGTFGTAYEDIGGFSSGSSLVQTFKGIPNTIWMALSPAHHWCDLKTRPQKDKNIAISTEELSKLYGLPIGYSLFRDAAWQIPSYLAEHNISYVGWKQLKPGRGAVVLKDQTETDHFEEYHVDSDVPFVVHQRSSRNYTFRQGISANFYVAVDVWLTDEINRSPRWTYSTNV